MKRKTLLILALTCSLAAVCFSVDPPGSHFQAATAEISASAANVDSFIPTNNGFAASEGVALFVIAASVVALASRRTHAVVKTIYRASGKYFVAVANRGVQKLTENHRCSNSNRDGLFAMIGAGSGDAPIGSGSGG